MLRMRFLYALAASLAVIALGGVYQHYQRAHARAAPARPAADGPANAAAH